MLEKLCKRIQHCCSTLRRSRNIRNVGNCWVKSLTGFKLCEKLPSTPNNMQQGVQTNTTCSIQQCGELLANMRPFARCFRQATGFACLKPRANGMYLRPFMLCLYYICEQKFYARKNARRNYPTVEIHPKRYNFYSSNS